jgi:hypothetical protein
MDTDTTAIEETVPDGEATNPTPEQHYKWGMEALSEAHTLGIGTSTEALLAALAHAMLGGLRDGLDYAATKAVRVEPGSPIYDGPEFEEDDQRP